MHFEALLLQRLIYSHVNYKKDFQEAKETRDHEVKIEL